MSRTTPVKKMDKNGRLVTRHVRTSSLDESPKRAMPKLSVLEDTDKWKKELATEIASCMMEDDDPKGIQQQVETFVENFKPSTMRLVISRMHGFTERDWDIFDSVAEHVCSDPDETAKNDKIKTLVEVLPVIGQFGREKIYPKEISRDLKDYIYGAFVNSVDILGIGGKPTKETADDFRWIAFEKIVTKASTARDSTWIRNESQWLMSNLDKLAPHRDTILQRGTVDRDFLESLISDDTASALKDGLL